MAETTKWQYKVFVGYTEEFTEIPVGPDRGALCELHGAEDTGLEITLSELGAEGWELASAVPTEQGGRDCAFFIFKRPVPPEEGKPYYS